MERQRFASMVDRACRVAIELVLVAAVLAAPWAFGGTHPKAVPALYLLVSLAVSLWAIRLFLRGSPPWRADGALWCLIGLVLLTGLQLLPLPAQVLRTLSPQTLEINERLRPAQLERLPDERGEAVPRPTNFPISLSPTDTRDFLSQLLVVTLLYATARNNLTGPGPLRRLAWAAVVNGALLCLLGIAQRGSSPSHVIYWTFETEGTVFGPFVNRNHLPFYVNACVGLGGGLLAARFRKGAFDLLLRPTALWLAVAVAVMIIGVALSNSRGGAVAGVAGGGTCLLVWFGHSKRAAGLGWVLGAATATAAGVLWIGWTPLTARFGNFGDDHLTDEGRIQMWREALSLFVQYPLVGTGSGTYVWIEPSARTITGAESKSAVYAHNEYVEALVEGGVLRFALLIALVTVPIVRVVRRHARIVDRPEAPLLLGGLFGFVAIAAHSVVDFGIHLPAVAAMAAMLLACVMAATDRTAAVGAFTPRPITYLAALGLMATAALLTWDAWTAYRAELSREATPLHRQYGPLSEEEAERSIRLLAAASEGRPSNALYRHELGQACLSRALTKPTGSTEQSALLREALGHWRRARDLNPLMAPSHARLGRYRNLFDESDPAIIHFERARFMLPTDPEIIFVCGQSKWEAGEFPAAMSDWKASLTSSDVFLDQILALARQRLSPLQVLDGVLPDRADVILRAADRLLPEGFSKTSADRRAYLERARDALSTKGNAKNANEWELEARLEMGLGRRAEGIAAYRRALASSPRQTKWRMAFAEVLRQEGAFKEARWELETVTAQEPGNRAAMDMLGVVIREEELAKRE